MTTSTPLSLSSKLLNEQLVYRALCVHHHINNNESKSRRLNILRCAFKLSSVSGENFCSDIYIAEVEYELDGSSTMECSFICKIMLPETEAMTSNEREMYETVLPGMEECLKAIALAGNQECNSKLNARCLLSEHNGQEYYVLENLNTLGYFCADRIKSLDEVHGQLVMEKIGQFHAASMLYVKKHPEEIDSLHKSHFVDGATDVVAQSITFGGLQYVSHMIASWPGYEHLAPKLKNLIPRFNGLVSQLVDPNNALFNVLNHGDLWINNLLFKTEKETKVPTDVLFVDFQNSFWSGCGYDLNWFLYTSLELQVLKEKRFELLKCYYNSLRKTLEKALYPMEDIPTWDQILLEVQRGELIALYTSLCEYPIVACEKVVSKDFTLDCFSNDEKMRKLRNSMYANERVKTTLMYTLKYFEEIGILD